MNWTLESMIILVLLTCLHAAIGRREQPVYSNEFAVHIPEGDVVAETLADKHGFVNRGQVSY